MQWLQTLNIHLFGQSTLNKLAVGKTAWDVKAQDMLWSIITVASTWTPTSWPLTCPPSSSLGCTTIMVSACFRSKGDVKMRINANDISICDCISFIWCKTFMKWLSSYIKRITYLVLRLIISDGGPIRIYFPRVWNTSCISRGPTPVEIPRG